MQATDPQINVKGNIVNYSTHSCGEKEMGSSPTRIHDQEDGMHYIKKLDSIILLENSREDKII